MIAAKEISNGNVYQFKNAASSTYMDLINGGDTTDPKNHVAGYPLVDDSDSFSNQYFLLRKVQDDDNPSLFNIINIRTGGYLEITDGSTDIGARVCCQKVNDDDPERQQWLFTKCKKGDGWRVQNYAARNKSNTAGYLDLKDGKVAKFTLIQGHFETNADAQAWELVRKSRSSFDIVELAKSYPVLQAVNNAEAKYAYVQIPNVLYRGIWDRNMPSKLKRGVYDQDARAIAFKNAFNNWADKLFGGNGFFVLFGLALGPDGGEPGKTIWFLNDDCDDVMFFHPEGAGMMSDPLSSFTSHVAFF